MVAIAATVILAGSAFAQDIKIGFLLKTMQEERYKRDRAAFTAKAEELGAKVIFDFTNNDELTQLVKFENMLAKGATVIVLQPVNTGTAGSMVSMANNEGVRVVCYDSMLVDGPLDAMVMQDSWAVEWLKAKKGSVTGKIALIQGRLGDSNAIAMSSGVLEIVEANPGLGLVTTRRMKAGLQKKG